MSALQPTCPVPARVGDALAGFDPLLPVRLLEGQRAYVAGFLLDGHDRVALVTKHRPAWQAGLRNAVGGKVEPGESPAAAMRREFAEETGLDVGNWQHLACLTFPTGAVWFFRAFATPATLDSVRSVTDEPVAVYSITDQLGPGAPIIPNLRWLLPLAAYTRDTYAPVLAAEIVSTVP